jgi:prevent-host-death family protein
MPLGSNPSINRLIDGEGIPMTKSISATEARVHLGEVLDQVEHSGARIVIERDGKPAAMLISLSDSEKLGEQELDVEALIERARLNRKAVAEWRAEYRTGEPYPDIVEMIHEMREERDAQLLDNMLRR